MGLHVGYVVRDTLIFTASAILFGFFIDFIFPSFSEDESTSETVLLLIVQILIDALLIALVLEIYKKKFGNDPDLFIGSIVFIVVFFLVQVQLFHRLSKIYKDVTGIKLVE